MAIIKLKDILKETDNKYNKLTAGSVNRLIRFGINRLIRLLQKDNEVLLQKNKGNVLFCKDFSNLHEYFTYVGEFNFTKRNRDNRLKSHYKSKLNKEKE